MKNNLFKKFLALFLTGTMLGAVGCKDYDDDINDLKGQIDDLKGKIELKADASALQTLQSEINLKFENYATNAKVDGISDEVAKCLKSSELAQKLKDLGYETSAKIMEEVKGLGYQNASDVAGLISAQLTEANIWSKINSKVTTEIGEYLKKNGIGTEATNKVLTAVKEAVANDKDLTGIRDAIVKLMGSQFAGQMSDYIAKNTTAWNNAVSTATMQILEDGESTLYMKIAEIAKGAVASPDLGSNAAWLSQNDLTAAFAEYDKVALRVAELEGRIQSVVYVPASLDEAQDNTVYFQGAAYIEDTDHGNTKYYLTNVGVSTATLTFKVSPASKAAEIKAAFDNKEDNDDNITFFAKEIDRTRAAGDKVTFTVDEVITSEDGLKEGLFSVKISTDYTFSEAVNPLAFAMNIHIASAQEGNSFGIDYTTAYMGADASEGGKINDKLVVAKKDGDTWVEINNGATTYETELSYDSKATVKFFDPAEFKVYYKTTDTGDKAYKDPADLWGTSLTVNFKAPAAAATGAQGTSGTAYDENNYTFNATNFKFKGADPVPATIGNVITSGDYDLQVSVGELKNFSLFKAKQQVTIIGKTDAYAANPATLAWNYTNATTGSNVYELKNIDMKDAISMAKYKELKAMSYNATPDQVGNYVVTIMKGDEDKTADFTIDANSFKLSSDPQTESDPMRVDLALTIDAKDAAKAGEYTVTAKYCIEAGVYNTISVPLTVKAMPELVAGNKLTLTLSKGYDGSLVYTVAEDFTKLIPYVEAAHKEAFNDKNTFDAFVAALTAGASTADDKAELSLDTKAIKVTFTAPFEFGKEYTPSIVLTSSLVDVTVESSCTLADPAAKMTPDENFLTDGVAKTTATLGSTFAVVDKELKDAYSYTGPVQNTTISYEVANEDGTGNAAVQEQFDALATLSGTAPTVDSKKLKWNDWNGLSLIVKASLKDNNNIVLDTQYFTVKVDNPVKDSAIAVKEADAAIYAGTATTLDLSTLLTLKDMNDANLFDSAQADGLAADAKTALTGEATYEIVGEHPAYITIADKTVSYVKGSLELSKVVTVQVKVTYTNKFMAEPLSATFDVKVQEGTKPAN